MEVVVQPYLISPALYHTIVRMSVEPCRIKHSGKVLVHDDDSVTWDLCLLHERRGS